MSLTSELTNPNSHINLLLDSILPAELVEKIVKEHNQILANASIIRPPSDSNLMMVGSAMTHAFYRQVTGTWGFDKPTMAMYGIRQVMSPKRMNHFLAISQTAKQPLEKALIALVLAYYDGVARGQEDRELKKVLTANVFNKQALPTAMGELSLQQHPLLNTIWDIANLVESFHLGWVNGLQSDDINVNATFAGSQLVGGADAQMISNGILIDIKTSRLKAPFTKKDLYQQLAYWLLDCDNQWNLNEIVWVYPRHQMFLRYGIQESFLLLPYHQYLLKSAF